MQTLKPIIGRRSFFLAKILIWFTLMAGFTERNGRVTKTLPHANAKNDKDAETKHNYKSGMFPYNDLPTRTLSSRVPGGRSRPYPTGELCHGLGRSSP
jgi:hypothetical protein